MNQKVFSRKELLTVGETPAVTIEDAKKYAPLDNKELSMVFQFELMNVDGAEVNRSKIFFKRFKTNYVEMASRNVSTGLEFFVLE